MRYARLALAALACCAAPSLAQIDGSGTITTGGTAQTVFPAPTDGSLRSYLFCQNPITATETLFMNAPTAAGAANGSWELAPGGSQTFGVAGGFVPQGAVSVYGATTGHRYICKRG